MLVCLVIDETVWKVYFAGNYDNEWFIRNARMWTTTYMTWFLMNLLSTCVSLFGIYKINQTVKDLKILEPKLKTNLWMQSLHGFLLLL